MDPKDVPICCEFALLLHEQKEQKKSMDYMGIGREQIFGLLIP